MSRYSDKVFARLEINQGVPSCAVQELLHYAGGMAGTAAFTIACHRCRLSFTASMLCRSSGFMWQTTFREGESSFMKLLRNHSTSSPMMAGKNVACLPSSGMKIGRAHV